MNKQENLVTYTPNHHHPKKKIINKGKMMMMRSLTLKGRKGELEILLNKKKTMIEKTSTSLLNVHQESI